MSLSGPASIEVLANSTVQIAFAPNTYNFTKYVFFNTSASPYIYQVVNSTDAGGEIVRRLGYTRKYDWTNSDSGQINYTWNVTPEPVLSTDGSQGDSGMGQVTGQTVRFDYLFNTGQKVNGSDGSQHDLILTTSSPNYTIVNARSQTSGSGVSARARWSIWGILLLSSVAGAGWCF